MHQQKDIRKDEMEGRNQESRNLICRFFSTTYNAQSTFTLDLIEGRGSERRSTKALCVAEYFNSRNKAVGS